MRNCYVVGQSCRSDQKKSEDASHSGRMNHNSVNLSVSAGISSHASPLLSKESPRSCQHYENDNYRHAFDINANLFPISLITIINHNRHRPWSSLSVCINKHHDKIPYNVSFLPKKLSTSPIPSIKAR